MYVWVIHMTYILLLEKRDYSVGLIQTTFYSSDFFQNSYDHVTPLTLVIKMSLLLGLNLWTSTYFNMLPNASRNEEDLHRILSVGPFGKFLSLWKYVLLTTKLFLRKRTSIDPYKFVHTPKSVLLQKANEYRSSQWISLFVEQILPYTVATTPPLSAEATFQDPQWMAETIDSTEAYIHYEFSFTYITMIMFTL